MADVGCWANPPNPARGKRRRVQQQEKQLEQQQT